MERRKRRHSNKEDDSNENEMKTEGQVDDRHERIPQEAAMPHPPYRDYANFPVDANVDPDSVWQIRGLARCPFPLTLHRFLDQIHYHQQQKQLQSDPKEGDNAEKGTPLASLGELCSWLPHGRAFRVHDRVGFETEVLPNYFSNQKSFGSFQRQLNLYGFWRLTKKNEMQGAYYHQLFLRGRPDLTVHIHRTQVRGTRVRQPVDTQSEPNLSLYPALPNLIPSSANHSSLSTSSAAVTRTATQASIPQPRLDAAEGSRRQPDISWSSQLTASNDTAQMPPLANSLAERSSTAQRSLKRDPAEQEDTTDADSANYVAAALHRLAQAAADAPQQLGLVGTPSTSVQDSLQQFWPASSSSCAGTAALPSHGRPFCSSTNLPPFSSVVPPLLHVPRHHGDLSIHELLELLRQQRDRELRPSSNSMMISPPEPSLLLLAALHRRQQLLDQVMLPSVPSPAQLDMLTFLLAEPPLAIMPAASASIPPANYRLHNQHEVRPGQQGILPMALFSYPGGAILTTRSSAAPIAAESGPLDTAILPGVLRGENVNPTLGSLRPDQHEETIRAILAHLARTDPHNNRMPR